MNHSYAATSTSPGSSRRPLLYRLCYEERPRRRATMLFAALTVLLTLIVAFFSFQDGLLPFDRQLSTSLSEADLGPLQPLFDLVAAPGYAPWNFIMAAGLVTLVAFWLNWKVALFYTAITLIQGVITVAMKFPIQIPRPKETDLNAGIAAIENSSFPSGHVTMYVVLFGFLLYLLWRHGAPDWLRWPVLIISLVMLIVIGPARVALGAHWIGDVIVAYLLGTFVVLLSIELYEKWLLPRLDLDRGDGYDL